jgi:Clostripain family
MGSACLAAVVGNHSVLAANPRSVLGKSRHPWVLLYWMPYDNDLERYGEPILEMLRCATQNTKTAVVVQSDYRGNSKMRRRQIVQGVTTEIEVMGEDSSDASALADYLDWANQTFEGQHWAVMVVGHGGKINEVSPDDHSTTSQPRSWMSVEKFATVVSNFNTQVDRRVELLFFQNCNKATIEVMYEARNCARYTLASQLNLGAPNYYYQGLLDRLKSPSVKGREAALAIMDSEDIDMFHTLTLVDNSAIKGLPQKFAPLLHSLLTDHLPDINQLDLSTYDYFGEQHCDALSLLDQLSKSSHQGRNEFNKFSHFLRSSVITAYKTRGKLYGSRDPENQQLEKLSGLGLYLPENSENISRYCSLSLYQVVDLVSLYRKIMKPIVSKP